MRDLLSGTILFVALLTITAGGQVSATTETAETNNAALLEKINFLENRVLALETQVRLLQDQSTRSPASASGSESIRGGVPESVGAQHPVLTEPILAQVSASNSLQTRAQPGLGGPSAGAAKVLNPDISMVGDFIAAVGHDSVQPFPALQMHESELGVQAIIDPYARGDFFLSFGEEGVGLEEGYVTFTALPANFVVRVGKMRSGFGKVNTMHNHVLPWVDRPLVTNNLVAGEDGINDASISVQRILQGPKNTFFEVTGQLFRGDSGDVFKATNKDDIGAVAHVRGYKDLSESTNLDLGLSYARGHNDMGSNFLTHLYGIDATLRWKPLRRSIYRSFIGRGEFIWSQRQQLPFEQRAFGFYTSAEYQLKRRWFLGGRYDQSDRSRFANQNDKGSSVVLTYWPTEFSQVRGQYRFMRYAGNIDSHELLMQVLFSLGAHGAHPF